MEQRSAEHGPIEQMQAVTISREYGSGGGEVASRLAHLLGWRLLDHEAVIQVAQEMGISVTDAEAQDEHVESLGMRLLNGLSLIQPPMSNAMHVISVPNETAYHEAMRRVVETAFTTGHVVIVGRGSQMQLKERREVLHVRVVAPLEQRIAYAMQREGLNHEDALARVRYKDNGRARYLQTQYHQNPADPLNYDLIINTAVLSLDDATRLIHSALEYKAARLSLPASQLGAVEGLPLYPGHSEDFGMSSDNAPTGAK